MDACNNVALKSFRIPDWNDYKKEFQEKGWFDSKVEKPDDWASTGAIKPETATSTEGSRPIRTSIKLEHDHAQAGDLVDVLESWLPGEGEEFPNSWRLRHGPSPTPICSRTTTRS